jgi:hypothetical protein
MKRHMLRGPILLPGICAFGLAALLELSADPRFPPTASGPCVRQSRPASPKQVKLDRETVSKLRDIHGEVREMAKYPGEDFVRREFFVGKGDDDTYKDFHLVVLIQVVAAREKMTLQVTRLDPSAENPRVKYGKDVRLVVCWMDQETVEVVRSDYEDRDLAPLLPEMLRCIRERKLLVRD